MSHINKMELLFGKECLRNLKRFPEPCGNEQVYRRRKGEPFTDDLALQIATSNAKVSADGTLDTHLDLIYETEAITPGFFLIWNGVQFAPTFVQLGLSTEQVSFLASSNAIVSADGSINTHSDVQYVGQDNALLVWDGVNWVAGNPIYDLTVSERDSIAINSLKVSANGTLDSHSDVAYMGNITFGSMLIWDGVNWVNSR